MVTCKRCGEPITLDQETLETDELWNESNTIYVNGECDECKSHYKYVLTIAKTYENDD